VVHIGLTVAEFWDMTPREFVTLQNVYFEKEKFKDGQEWKRIRWSTCLILNQNSKEKIVPQDLFILDSERTEQDDAVMDEATRAKLNQEWDEQERLKFLEKKKIKEAEVSNPK